MFEIEKTLDGSVNVSNFVAIGALVQNSNAYHSALIIQLDRDFHLFHFESDGVKYEQLGEESDYYHKITDIIPADEVESFIARCEFIKSKASPRLGYFYTGSLYNEEGAFIGNEEVGEVMTCVGFCISVLKGFLEMDTDYIQYTDWGKDSHKDNYYLQNYCRRNNLAEESLAPYHRRISPMELLTSAYFNKCPITKAQIDSKIEDVKNTVKNLERGNSISS